MRDRPFVPFGAAGGQAAEAAGVCAASVLSAIDTATGKAYEVSSGVALTVIGFATALALAWVAVGLARARPWSWMPALLIQLFTLITGIYLLQSHRYNWGTPAVLVPVAVAVLLLLPRSLDTFGRRPTDEHRGRRPTDEHRRRRPTAAGQESARAPAKAGSGAKVAPAKGAKVTPAKGAKVTPAKGAPAPKVAPPAKGRASRPRSGRP
jgi:hypothetical protein